MRSEGAERLSAWSRTAVGQNQPLVQLRRKQLKRLTTPGVGGLTIDSSNGRIEPELRTTALNHHLL